MTGELTIFRQGNQLPSTAFQGVALPSQRLDDGISAGFAKVSYKGGKWGIKYQGQYYPVQARLPDGTLIPSPFLDVVLLKTASHPAKAFYEGVYQEGDNAPPDCWSTNGITPDLGVPKKQCNTCAGCPNNVWGSKINRDTGLATRGKACMDSKRVAVVPVGDIENTVYGGPMMLSIPPTSLRRLGPYQNLLEANGFHYATVWTRITFEQQSAYPLMIFDALGALNDVQAGQVIKMIDHPLVDRILETEMQAAEAWDESAQQTHATHPTQPVQPQQPAQQPVQPQQAPPQQPVQQPVPTPPAQPEEPAKPQIALPPGMTQEMFDGLPEPVKQAMIAAAAVMPEKPAAPASRGRGRPTKPRTPPVSPAPADTSQQAAQPPVQPPPPAQPAQPQPTMVMALPGTGNGAAQPQPAMVTGTPGNDPAVGAIMSTLRKLV